MNDRNRNEKGGRLSERGRFTGRLGFDDLCCVFVSIEMRERKRGSITEAAREREREGNA